MDIPGVKDQVMDNQEQAAEVQHQVIRLSHRAGQVLLQVHLHQETTAAAVAAGKAVVLADHVDIHKINGVM
jgi:hypothetical protein